MYHTAHKYIFTSRLVSSSNPRKYDDTCDVDLSAEVDHPDRSVDVEVVEHGASIEGRVSGAVDSSAGVTVLPARSHVPLHLATVTDPRLLVVSHVLHCITVIIDTYT